jgi:glycosyltransferase involved in cell wall biosynthesis
MPARGRRELALRAVDCFFAQDYPHKELLIYDDVDELAFNKDDIERFSRLGGNTVTHFAHIGQRLTIANKRNFLCEQARGEIIMHFDSDDWSAPTRMSDQVGRLVESGLAVTGYHSMLFYDEDKKLALKYRGWVQSYALGTTLAFLRSWWEQHPFPLMQVLKAGGPEVPIINGEDNKFVEVARKQNPKQIISVDAGKLMVARIHKENTCPKDVVGCSFQPLALTDLPKDFF